MDKRLLFSALATLLLVTPASAEAHEPYVFAKDLTKKERELAGHAMRIVERECPALRSVDWTEAKASIAPGGSLPFELHVTRPDDFWQRPEDPEWSTYRWGAYVSIYYQPTVEEPTLDIRAGAGQDGRPGIMANGYASEICRFDSWDGKWSFIDVPDLQFLDQLARP